MMKKTLTLFLFSLFLLGTQSCSNDDDNSTPEIVREVVVHSSNATLSHVLIKSGNDILFQSSNVGKEDYYQKITNRKEVYIEATAIVDANGKAKISLGELIGGDVFSATEQTEKEQATKGEEIKVSGTITLE